MVGGTKCHLLNAEPLSAFPSDSGHSARNWWIPKSHAGFFVVLDVPQSACIRNTHAGCALGAVKALPSTRRVQELVHHG
jgi:hypothetical protein